MIALFAVLALWLWLVAAALDLTLPPERRLVLRPRRSRRSKR